MWHCAHSAGERVNYCVSFFLYSVILDQEASFHLQSYFATSSFHCRRKLTQKLQETEEALGSASQKASNAEKAKNRLNSELEDALIDLEKVQYFTFGLFMR